MPVLSIAGRELRSLFVSPLAWAALALVQFVLAWMFLVQLDRYVALQPQLAGIAGAPGVSDLLIAPWLANAGLVIVLLTPLLSMRLLSQEIANGSLHLLLAAPVGLGQIVLGKYLGLLGFLALLLILAAAMALSLMAGGELDLAEVDYLLRLANEHEGIRFEASCPEGIVMTGNRQQLSQVLVNLLSNAADASKPGDRVDLLARGGSDEAIIEVMDQGQGIPEEIQESIFEPFYTTKPTGQGTGLGLSLAYKIIEDHNGTLTIDSQAGFGTRVVVTLPLQEDERPYAPVAHH